jgi:SAM-dependent methyltransferase
MAPATKPRWKANGFSASSSAMTADTPKIFDRTIYLARQAKARSLGAQAPLLAHVAAELDDRLSVINHQFGHVAVIAGQPQPFVDVLATSGKCAEVQVLHLPENDALGLAPLSCDAIFHLMDLHCVNDVPGTLAQCARALKPNGLFMAVFFAGDSLLELRDAWLVAESESGGVTPRVAPMIGLREMGGLLQRAGLALPVADADRLTLRYADVLALLREIKAMGFANPLAERRKSLTAARLLSALAQAYPRDPDGRIRATLELSWALAWKPHESQQKPKAPGSATHRLVDFLKPAENEK